MENKHVKTLSQATLKQSAAKGGMWRVSNFLSISLVKLLVQLQIKSVKDRKLLI